jgi:hypothetical protein
MSDCKWEEDSRFLLESHGVTSDEYVYAAREFSG